MDEFERDGVKYVAREKDGCDGCSLLGAPGECGEIVKCASKDRDDGRSIIWVRAGIASHTVLDQLCTESKLAQLPDDKAKAELARWRDSTQHWIVRDGELVNFVLGNAFTTDDTYPGTQSEPLLEHIQNLRHHAEALEGDLAAARAELAATKADRDAWVERAIEAAHDRDAARSERDRLQQQQLAENNAALARRMGI